MPEKLEHTTLTHTNHGNQKHKITLRQKNTVTKNNGVLILYQ